MNLFRTLATVLALATGAACAAPETLNATVESVARPGAIAAANEPRPGLFVADLKGALYLHETDGPVEARRRVIGLEPVPDLPVSARGAVLRGSELFLFDGDASQVLVVRGFGSAEETETKRFEHRLNEPTHMAVSPQGLVAVIDDDRLVFLDREKSATSYEELTLAGPAGLNFTTWNTLQVLDNSRQSLVTVRFNRLADGSVNDISHERRPVPSPEGSPWRAMAVHQGMLHLATATDVFAYVEETGELVSVLGQLFEFEDIQQVAISDHGLYLMHGGDLSVVPRNQVVDLVLEGDAKSSQRALLTFYTYLDEHGLLPSKVVLSEEASSAEQLLFERDAIIAPIEETGWPEVRIYQEGRRSEYSQASIGARTRGEPNPWVQERADIWESVLCPLNPERCATGNQDLVPDERVRIPALTVRRSLTAVRIELDRAVEDYLDELIFSDSLRAQVDEQVLQRLNTDTPAPIPANAHLSTRSSGAANLPAEIWAITAAVPAIHYNEPDSALWQLVDSHYGASVRSRAAFVSQGSESTTRPSAANLPPNEHCRVLQEASAQLRTAVGYPVLGQNWFLETQRSRAPWVGVLENSAVVEFRHQIFRLNPAKPTWHSLGLFGLTPDPALDDQEVSPQRVLDSETYSRDAHHGTHVAGLIAGRTGECWSGLIPNARLLMVDLKDIAQVVKSTRDAIDANVRVFNVSQRLDQDGLNPRDLQTLFDLVLDDRALWVVAAGNQKEDLDRREVSIVPVPVRWSRSNVVTVTLSDAEGQLLDTIGNYGRRYVDLVAPGERIFSATDNERYGPATGTSQATPLVAAAASFLVDPRTGTGVAPLTPGDAKARLIATAEWQESYRDRVWGGRFNFADAVMFPDRNILRTRTGGDRFLYSITYASAPRLRIVNGHRPYERLGSGGSPVTLIDFEDVLSLRQSEDGTFRVVFKNANDELKLLLRAEIEPERQDERIRCTRKQWDEPTSSFLEDDGCRNGLAIAQIEAFFRAAPYSVTWKENPQ